jgi:hypothetical protein
MKRRPVLGAICGLVFGLFVALDLQQFSVRPLDSLSLFGLPLLGLLIGLALGMTSPLGFLRKGDRGTGTTAAAVPMGPSGEGVHQGGSGSSSI